MNEVTGPKQGEKWTIGAYKNLIFQGMGRDFTQQKYFVFDDIDAGSLFIISKDEFFSDDLKKVKCHP